MEEHCWICDSERGYLLVPCLNKEEIMCMSYFQEDLILMAIFYITRLVVVYANGHVSMWAILALWNSKENVIFHEAAFLVIFQRR